MPMTQGKWTFRCHYRIAAALYKMTTFYKQPVAGNGETFA